MPQVRFCPWYPLAQARHHAPAAANLLQLRVAHGLVPYPRGQSAMVCYQLADDARACAEQLAERWPDLELWCRHLIELDEGEPVAAQARAAHERLLAEFVRRFGAEPRYVAPAR